MYTFETYKDKKKEWRWRLKANNGKVIADSAESYKRNPERQIMKITLALGLGKFKIVKK